ncbi:hypothetical protein [Aquimarina algiphila]|uniref:hypothetical protein n=1 Tax=Aquimarina algiphila TaxID=2047982 RepID=UPI00232F418B|nr:hypothetical protein [Aquimarina algiphila]
MLSKSQKAIEVNSEFIKLKISRAYCGISYITVKDCGKKYATLKNKVYSYFDGVKEYSGKRSERASIKIFTGLIDRHKNFECDDIEYYFNDNSGVWMWMEVH